MPLSQSSPPLEVDGVLASASTASLATAPSLLDMLATVGEAVSILGVVSGTTEVETGTEGVALEEVLE